jgi:hypothetical protein
MKSGMCSGNLLNPSNRERGNEWREIEAAKKGE